MAALPTEIIAEILCMLPVKTLIRFLCVSKSWLSLIKSPKFIKQHLNRTLKFNSHRHLLLTYSTLSSSTINRQFKFSKLNHPLKLKFPENHHEKKPCPLGGPFESCPFEPSSKTNIIFWGSCNGVICISDAKRNDVVLFNPATKTYRNLPATEYPCPKEFAVFGLGYDSESDDYKVLRMMQCVGPNDEIKNDARVYSLKSNSWRRVSDIPYSLIFPDTHGVFVNGSLHYVVSEIPFQSEYKSIAKFDLKTESYSLLDCPDYDHSMRCWTLYLGDLGGRLSCSVNYDFHGSADVWIMDEYGKKDSWIRLLRISKMEKETILIDVKAIAWCNNGKMILTVVDNELRWYDMRGRRGIRAGVLEGMPGENFEAGTYVESLVMLDEEKVTNIVAGSTRKDKVEKPGGGTTTRKGKK
ncbi:hypothetical protein RDABS01_036350 [Bienertia sinuspersici]